MPRTIYNVLFLCTGNSARSIMAESILNKLGKDRFRAFSAGSAPAGRLHPDTASLLRNLGYDLSLARSKSWSEFVLPGAPTMDFIFTVCDRAAGEACPVWPGQPVTCHWGVPDPAAVPADAADRMDKIAVIYRTLRHRIEIFADLRIEVLDQLSLKTRLEQIGRSAA
jgi:protein-tyrosine-phosphatase